MKKLLLLLAVCFTLTLTSCQFYYETIAEPDECAYWYLEQLYEAAEDGDVDAFNSYLSDLRAWENSLTQEELLQSEQGGYNYGLENPNDMLYILEFAQSNSIVIY